MKQIAKMMIPLALLLLAACGGAAPTATVPPSPPPTDASSSDSAETGVAALTVGSPEFSVQISGALEGEMPPGSAIYGGLGTVENIPPRHQLLFFDSDVNGMRQITLEFDPKIKPGTYEFNGGAFGLNGGTIVAAFSTFTVGADPDANTAFDFDQQVSGSLTLSAVGDFASGSFSFTATDSIAQKTITISGEFKNIAFVGG